MMSRPKLLATEDPMPSIGSAAIPAWKLLAALLWLSLAILLLRPTWSHAGEVAGDASGIRAYTDGAVHYVTGGIALDHRRDLDGMAKDYNLKLVFAEASESEHRPLVAGVRVRIVDESGRDYLTADDAGPWVLAKLSDGSYRDRDAAWTGDRKAREGREWPCDAARVLLVSEGDGR